MNFADMISQLNRKFKINFKHLCSFLFCCFKKAEKKRLIYSLGMELIYRDCDILRVINALHDIEKLKYILLNQ